MAWEDAASGKNHQPVCLLFIKQKPRISSVFPVFYAIIDNGSESTQTWHPGCNRRTIINLEVKVSYWGMKTLNSENELLKYLEVI